MMTAECVKTYQLRVADDGEVVGRIGDDDGEVKFFAAADVQDAGERLDQIAKAYQAQHGGTYERAFEIALDRNPGLRAC